MRRANVRAADDERRGIAVVEFAMLAPLLLVLTLGTLEIARGLMVKEALTEAARRACRTASLPTATRAAVEADVAAVLADNNIARADVSITTYVNDRAADVSTARENDKVAVLLSVPSSRVCWVTPWFLLNRQVESRTVAMLRQK